VQFLIINGHSNAHMNCVIAGFLTVHCMVYIVEDTCAPLNQFFLSVVLC